MRRLLSTLIVLGALAAVVRSGPAQELNKPIRGQVQAGAHSFELDSNAAYVATLTSKNTRLDVSVTGVNAQRQFNFDEPKDKVYKEEVFFSPVKKAKALVRVAPGFDTPGGPHDYTLEVKRLAFDKKPLLETKGVLTNKDRAGPGKIIQKGFPLKLAKGRLYVAEVAIDLDGINPCPGFEPVKEGANSSYSVAGYEGKVGRLVFRSTADLDYRAQAGIFDELKAGQTCKFTLTVYQAAKE
jgi:hypothetical protein